MQPCGDFTQPIEISATPTVAGIDPHQGSGLGQSKCFKMNDKHCLIGSVQKVADLGHFGRGLGECSRKKPLVGTAETRRQLRQTIQRRAKVKGRRPADNLLNRRPDLNQKPIPFSAFGVQDNLPPLSAGTSSRRKRLQCKATNGKSCDASFT